jgi:hypothetical protein
LKDRCFLLFLLPIHPCFKFTLVRSYFLVVAYRRLWSVSKLLIVALKRQWSMEACLQKIQNGWRSVGAA